MQPAGIIRLAASLSPPLRSRDHIRDHDAAYQYPHNIIRELCIVTCLDDSRLAPVRRSRFIRFFRRLTARFSGSSGPPGVSPSGSSGIHSVFWHRFHRIIRLAVYIQRHGDEIRLPSGILRTPLCSHKKSPPAGRQGTSPSPSASQTRASAVVRDRRVALKSWSCTYA